MRDISKPNIKYRHQKHRFSVKVIAKTDDSATKTNLDIDAVIQTYRLWCYRNAKEYIAPDLSKVEIAIHKEKPALILRTEKGLKLARLSILESGFSVSWVNWFIPKPRLVGKKKYLISRMGSK